MLFSETQIKCGKKSADFFFEYNLTTLISYQCRGKCKKLILHRNFAFFEHDCPKLRLQSFSEIDNIYFDTKPLSVIKDVEIAQIKRSDMHFFTSHRQTYSQHRYAFCHLLPLLLSQTLTQTCVHTLGYIYILIAFQLMSSKFAQSWRISFVNKFFIMIIINCMHLYRKYH